MQNNQNFGVKQQKILIKKTSQFWQAKLAGVYSYKKCFFFLKNEEYYFTNPLENGICAKGRAQLTVLLLRHGPGQISPLRDVAHRTQSLLLKPK